VGCAATKQMPIAVLGHPVGAGEMSFPDAAGAIRLAARIKVQQDSRNLFPSGAVGFRVEQAQICDLVPLVIAVRAGAVGAASATSGSTAVFAWTISNVRASSAAFCWSSRPAQARSRAGQGANGFEILNVRKTCTIF